MADDHALDALEAAKEMAGVNIPPNLLAKILEVEKKYAFDTEAETSALRELEAIIDAAVRDGASA